MKKKIVLIILIICVLGLGFYFYFHKNEKRQVHYYFSKPKIVLIQPLGDFDKVLAQQTYTSLKKIHSGFRLLKPIPLFHSAYYPPKDRYRADTILNILKNKYKSDTIILAMTKTDISVTKGKIKDWGIMGLAHRPGNVCVVSTYRLDKTKLKEQFYKVAIHELGHTQGLPHCPNKTCFMRDASGRNPLNEETNFCEKCKGVMKMKGWNL